MSADFLASRHPYLPEAHAAVFSSDVIVDEVSMPLRLLVLFASLPVSTQVAVAFGRRGVEKLIDVLTTPDNSDSVKLSALILLIGELSTQEKKADAIRSGAVDACTSLLRSSHSLCKANACIALSRLALLMPGRAAMRKSGSVLPLSLLCADAHEAVRRSAVVALTSLTYFRDGWDVFMECEKATEHVVSSLSANPSAVCALVNLTAFYTAASAAALDAGVMPWLVDALGNVKDNGILNYAVITLRHLAMHETGEQ
jgi:hypothetical protein